jgi:hypothetical protein
VVSQKQEVVGYYALATGSVLPYRPAALHQMPSWFSRNALSSRPMGNAHDLDMISVAEADRAMVRVF